MMNQFLNCVLRDSTSYFARLSTRPSVRWSITFIVFCDLIAFVLGVLRQSFVTFNLVKYL